MRIITGQVLNTMHHRRDDELASWLLTLGWEMTVAARAAYAVNGPGNLNHLTAFNEMQHRLYNYIRHDQSKEIWPLESLIETLFDTAEHQGVVNDLNWAVQSALRRLSAV